MYQIMKVVGVTPEALVRLHKVLDSDAVKTKKEVAVYTKSDSIPRTRILCAELLSSRLEEGGKTYRVEIKVLMKEQCLDPELSGKWKDEKMTSALLFPSVKIVRSIYDALDVYPEEEKLVKVEEP